MPDFTARLDRIQHHMRDYAHAPFAPSNGAELIAVSKQQLDTAIDTALAVGLRVFGENRVQEAQARWTGRRPHYPDLQLHLIGPLQSNKAADAVALFDVIHTINREKIAVALDVEMQRQNKTIPCFVQVNTGDEAQKAGIAPDALADFLTFCRARTQLQIVGLMCIPPVDAPPSLHFLLLRRLARQNGLSGLSMGMSDDYQTALRCGATHIRVGGDLFGRRAF